MVEVWLASRPDRDCSVRSRGLRSDHKSKGLGDYSDRQGDGQGYRLCMPNNEAQTEQTKLVVKRKEVDQYSKR